MYPKTDKAGEVLDTKAVLQACANYNTCRSLKDVLGRFMFLPCFGLGDA